MNILWDEEKNLWLQLNRNISFEEIADKILNNKYIEILEIDNYTWVVPFLIDENDEIILKTAFPSRKYHKKYGR